MGAGATSYRGEVLGELLAIKPAVIHGNASEIMALAKKNATVTKGVDSTNLSEQALDAAAEKCTPDERQQMLDAFQMASRLEWLFWDGAYCQRRWMASY